MCKICTYNKSKNCYEETVCGECNNSQAYENGARDMEKAKQVIIDSLINQIPKWIQCSERLPEDCDSRYYLCIVENHEEDLPIFCQYEEEYGFGYWQDIYDERTLGYLDSEFKTNEELGYEKVIAWMQLPEPYKESD